MVNTSGNVSKVKAFVAFSDVQKYWKVGHLEKNRKNFEKKT